MGGCVILGFRLFSTTQAPSGRDPAVGASLDPRRCALDCRVSVCAVWPVRSSTVRSACFYIKFYAPRTHVPSCVYPTETHPHAPATSSSTTAILLGCIRSRSTRQRTSHTGTPTLPMCHDPTKTLSRATHNAQITVHTKVPSEPLLGIHDIK